VVEGIERVARGERVPLSFAQQRLWFLDQFEGGSSLYLIPLVQHIRGPLDRCALSGSLRALAARHEILRTTFGAQAGQPYQRIASVGRPALLSIDLQGLAGAAQERLARQLAACESARPCDLAQGPLWRVTLLCLEAAHHLLILTIHHSIADGWSMQIIQRELALFYQAQLTGQAPELAALPVQYADYALWQRGWLTGAVLETQLRYWQQQLAAVPILELPTDHPRPPRQSFRGASHPLRLSKDLLTRLHALARQQRVTLFMLLLAAFQVLLARYSGQSDISVGVPVANRTRSALEGLIGFFVNTLVLRTDLSGAPSFCQLLARVREVALQAYTYQDLPFEYLVEVLQPQRDLSRNPLFQVMFILQNVPRSERELAGLGLAQQHIETTSAKFDLTLSLGETPEGLRGQIDYQSDLFEPASISRLAEHWQTLLEALVADPGQRISRLPLLSQAGRQQLLSAWNPPEQAADETPPLTERIEAQVARTPDALAVCCADACLTYHCLNQRANRCARALLDQGVTPELPVGLLAGRDLSFVSALLAIFKAGAAYLPLDPGFPASRLGQILGQSAPTCVLVTRAHRQLLARAYASAALPDTPRTLALEEQLGGPGGGENLALRCHPGQLAYIISTSGSTGTPKGVMVEHRGLLNHLAAKMADVQLSAGDRVAQNGPQCFDISIWQCVAALVQGGMTIVFGDALASDPRQLLPAIEEQAITVLQVVPAMLRALLQEPGAQALGALRFVLPTGDALPAELACQWLARYPHIPLLNTYGATECADDQCHYPVLNSQALAGGPAIVSIGVPIPNLQAYVLDREMQPLPPGIVGELYLGGLGVGRGYLNDPERSALAFGPDPFTPHAGRRLYRTGDLARWRASGTLEFLGRVDDLLKINGHRIEPGEIEAVLVQHPLVQQALVVARAQAGQAWLLVAYVVPADPAEPPSAQLLRAYLQQRLPAAMLPSAFVLLAALPLTANGKLDRRALPEPGSDASSVQEDVAPATAAEQVVAAIWQEILQLPAVGIQQNFFALGGHSLLATRIIARLNMAFQVDLPLRTLFEFPTIAGLLAEIALAHGGRAPVEEIAQLLQEIEQLSDDEVEQQLCSEMAGGEEA
jgi:amino acid adenylation domain-containing protein